VRDATVKAGRYKDLMSPLRPPNPEDRAIVQGIVDSMHARFKEVVGASRHLEGPRLAVPLDVDVGVGENWKEAKP